MSLGCNNYAMSAPTSGDNLVLGYPVGQYYAQEQGYLAQPHPPEVIYVNYVEAPQHAPHAPHQTQVVYIPPPQYVTPADPEPSLLDECIDVLCCCWSLGLAYLTTGCY